MQLNRKYGFLNFLLVLLCLFFFNVIASQYFFRLDLTEEKRYAISDNSKIILQNVDDVVFVEIFLEGDLPPGFKRLQRSIRETLDEFRVYSGANIQYKFTDPLAEKDERQKAKVFMDLAERGLQPTNLFANENGKQTEKLIFPGAIISYKGREVPVLLLKGAAGAAPGEVLNQSVEGVEFELISAMKKLSDVNRKRIGILEGHGELSNMELDDIYRTLKESYLVDRVNLSVIKNLYEYFDVLVIAKPVKYFSEEDKLKIDQFIVKGGRVLFLLDKVQVDEKKLGTKENLAVATELNLDDLLFRLGARINNTLIQDMQSGALPMVVGMMGDKPQTQLVPWRYFVVHTAFSKHPVVRNMSAVYAHYISSIDTVKSKGITKTPLMFTSRYVKEMTAPFPVELNEAKKQPDPNEFNRSPIITGVLLEGVFRSIYTNRLTEEKMDSIQFKSSGLPSKVIVFSDGDLIRNDVSPEGNQTYPLGFDKYMRKKFANKDLIENCITFLADENGIINTRSKEIKLRPLDKQKLKNQRSFWQLINVVLPVALIVLFGVIRYYYRKNKYTGDTLNSNV